MTLLPKLFVASQIISFKPILKLSGTNFFIKRPSVVRISIVGLLGNVSWNEKVVRVKKGFGEIRKLKEGFWNSVTATFTDESNLTIQKSKFPCFPVTSPLIELENPATIYPPSEVCWMEFESSKPVPPNDFCHWITPILFSRASKSPFQLWI